MKRFVFNNILFIQSLLYYHLSSSSTTTNSPYADYPREYLNHILRYVFPLGDKPIGGLIEDRSKLVEFCKLIDDLLEKTSFYFKSKYPASYVFLLKITSIEYGRVVKKYCADINKLLSLNKEVNKYIDRQNVVRLNTIAEVKRFTKLMQSNVLLPIISWLGLFRFCCLTKPFYDNMIDSLPADKTELRDYVSDLMFGRVGSGTHMLCTSFQLVGHILCPLTSASMFLINPENASLNDSLVLNYLEFVGLSWPQTPLKESATGGDHKGESNTTLNMASHDIRRLIL